MSNSCSTQSTTFDITKRDGRVEAFQPAKIIQSIKSAFLSADCGDMDLAETTSKLVLKRMQRDSIQQTDKIGEIIKNALLQLDQCEKLKAYCSYGQERFQNRNSKSHLMTTYQAIANAKAKDFNLKRDNANVDGDTAMGKMLQFGAEGSKEFSKYYMMKRRHAQAHDLGEIHIHDLDFFAMGTLTCCQIDVLQLFEKGFSTGHGSVRTPNSITSYSSLAAIALQSNQNEQYVGQSIPIFDYAMAQGVKNHV
jgi:ribonucleoside-triphosphate reductase